MYVRLSITSNKRPACIVLFQKYDYSAWNRQNEIPLENFDYELRFKTTLN